MYYIIGPLRSAEALARKTGLRKEEWKHVGRVDDISGRPYGNPYGVILSTHDAWRLPDYSEIQQYVESRGVDYYGEKRIVNPTISLDNAKPVSNINPQ